MIWLLDLLYGLAVCVGWPLLLIRRWRRGPGSLAIGERLGNVPSRPVSARCVWIHGVSLGEINATRTIVNELRQRLPDTVIVISATTQTGLARARELYPKLTVFRFPLDFSFVIGRVLERLRPSVIVLMELEAWPNLVAVAQRQEIPVLIANGRITADPSVRNFQRPVIRWFARRMFSSLDWIGAQDETYAQRFIAVGARPERVHVVGSVKYDAADVSWRIDGQDELADAMAIDRRRPLWVCGSTGPGEEELLLAAYARLRETRPELQLAIIPRKPERFDEVAELIAAGGFACLRRSGKPPLVPRGTQTPEPVFLGDTLGELRKFYALADVVFVGRSLVALGGSDVMEVAGLAKPVLIGPHVDNFAEAVDLLVQAGAARTTSAETLADSIDDLLAQPERRKVMGRAGRDVILSRRGATRRTVDVIVSYLE
jgi:3-deoxy-D-manno-octulosonic-acid transferase